MGDKTGIAWTDASWNPLVGCSRLSEGCRLCYAETMAGTRLKEIDAYKGLTRDTTSGPRWTGEVRFLVDRMRQPSRWKRPRRIFVNSMSDLFHESVPFEQIAAVLHMVAVNPRHTFQVLTKRPREAARFFADLERRAEASSAMFPNDSLAWRRGNVLRACALKVGVPLTQEEHTACEVWPLPNLHLGVTVENQAAANKRIDILLTLPAGVRWLSMEPLLEAVDLSEWIGVIEHCGNCGAETPGPVEEDECPACGHKGMIATFGGESEARWYRGDVGRFRFDVEEEVWRPYTQEEEDGEEGWNLQRLDWIVVGGESGGGARPFDLLWARDLVQQARQGGVAIFVKQLGRNPVEEEFKVSLRNPAGADVEEWPEDLRVQEFPGE